MSNGNLERLRASARQGGLVDDRTGKPQVAGILQAAAIDILRPDLGAEIRAGKLTIAQAQPEMVREFWRQYFDEARSRRERPQ